MGRPKYTGENRTEGSKVGDKLFLTTKEGKEVFIYARDFLNSSYISDIIVTIASGGGLTSVATDSSINGDGTVLSPLAVANPFPGFTSLAVDYGVTLATVATSGDYTDLINIPSVFDGDGIYDGSGALSANTTVSHGVHKLVFSSAIVDGFAVSGTALSVDGANNYVGFGLSNPTSPVHIKSATSLFSDRILNVNNGSLGLMFAITANGHFGMNATPTTGAWQTWNTPATLPSIGISYNYDSTFVGTQVAFDLITTATNNSHTSLRIRNTGSGTSNKSGLSLDIKGSSALNKAIQVFSGEVIFNEDGGDYNTRFEGLNNSAVFFLDAGKDAIGMGTSSLATGVRLTVAAADAEITGDGNGLILADRTTSTRYRIYMDGGVLSTETA